MDSAPLPPPLDQITTRPFSFFPPIVGIEDNEWRYQQATWSEILVVNDRTNQEIWVPRRYFGEVSSTDKPVLIVGLEKELEFVGGMLHPYKQRVLRMPSASADALSSSDSSDEKTAPFRGFRLDRNDKRIVRMMGIAVGAAILICAFVVLTMRVGDIRGRRVVFTTPDLSYQNLTGRDDRFTVVSKLGQPAFDRFKEVGTIQYEALSYPGRRYTVLLMGADTRTVVYIGTVDDRWKPIHSVLLKGGVTTEALLRNIDRF